MITSELKKTISGLNSKEKEKLAQLLWEDIYDNKNEIPFSREHKKILNERLLAIKKGKAKKRSWNEIKKDILSNAL
jgi:hypothetical protein